MDQTALLTDLRICIYKIFHASYRQNLPENPRINLARPLKPLLFHFASSRGFKNVVQFYVLVGVFPLKRLFYTLHYKLSRLLVGI